MTGKNDVAQVHIVLATYNGEKYIREQLNSLLENTYQDFSVEVCDDGSTDGTVKIVEEYMKKYGKIRLHQNEKNLGYVMNFMEGIRRSESPYIMLCDQDDIWYADKIETTFGRMLELEQSSGADVPLMVFTDAMNYDSETGAEMGAFHQNSRLDTRKIDTAHLFMENKCIGCTVMINGAVREYLDILPEEIRVHDWWLALICSNFGKISYINETTLQYRQHSGNMIGGSGFTDYMKNRVSNLHRQRAAIQETFAQGKAFYVVFGNRLIGKKKKIARIFASMPDSGWIARRWHMIRFGFCKSGLIRNAALFFLI